MILPERVQTGCQIMGLCFAFLRGKWYGVV